MSSAACASWTTRYAARKARGQKARKSASRSEADPARAPRTQARSSRPAGATGGPYGRDGRGGPCSEYGYRHSSGPGNRIGSTGVGGPAIRGGEMKRFRVTAAVVAVAAGALVVGAATAAGPSPGTVNGLGGVTSANG